MQSKDQTQNSTLPHIWFILLINTKSGGGWGRCYLQLKKHEFCFQYKKQYMVHVKLIDLFNTEKKTVELQKAKQLQTNKINDVRVIICGGDGSIIWGIEECLKAGLDFQQLLIGCLPIGTGNDFSRTIGWGSHPLEFKEGNILPFKKRIIEWINSSVSKYDVWQTEISIYDNGQIYIAKDGQDFLTDKKMHKAGFVNYVGVGIDGRVSYNFEKNRKSTRLMNYAVYIYFGCVLCCRSFPQLSGTIDTFEQSQRYDSNVSDPHKTVKEPKLDESLTQKLNEYDQGRSSKKINVKKGYHGLVCLNSTSYMGGALDAWKTKRIGCQQKSVKFQDQSYNDGKLQFLGYTNQIVLAMQKIMHTGSRVAQGQGPYEIRFKQQSLEYENYVQIDGEALKIKGIKEILIRRHGKIPSINVMVRNQKF